MKILFIIPSFYPYIGGVEKHTYEVIKRLRQKGYEVTVITEQQPVYKSKQLPKSNLLSNNQKEFANLEKFSRMKRKVIEGIPVIYCNFGKKGWLKKFRIWLALWKLRKVIQQSAIIHCHDVFLWCLPFRFLYFKKPVYTTFHGYEGYPITLKQRLLHTVSEKLSFGTICIGDFIKKWYGTKPRFVSYGAVKMGDKVLPNPPKESAVFIGRLDEATSILSYTRAVEKIRKQVPQFRFTIVGDGMYRKRIQKKFKVEGLQSNPERYLVRSRFAFVSRYLAILEALVYQRLVFAVYDNPVKKDYLFLTPFAEYIVKVSSEDELVDEVLYYLNHPEEEKEIIRAGYQWVKNQTWEKVVEMYEDLWRQGK